MVMTISTEAEASLSADIIIGNSTSDNSGCINVSHKLSNTLARLQGCIQGAQGDRDPPMAEWL